MEKKHVSLKDTAKIIRAELKAKFPDTKFSVRCSFYSMGSHIEVSYTDGPPTSAVEAITDGYYGRGFDGSTDSTTYHDTDYKGERVHFSGSRPSVSRHITDQAEIMGRIRDGFTKAEFHSYGEAYDWHVLSLMDLRWETPERAVSKFLAHKGVN